MSAWPTDHLQQVDGDLNGDDLPLLDVAVNELSGLGALAVALLSQQVSSRQMSVAVVLEHKHTGAQWGHRVTITHPAGRYAHSLILQAGQPSYLIGQKVMIDFYNSSAALY